MTRFPRIKFAALEIFYDNGMINRTTTEAEQLDKAYKVLQRNFTDEQLQAVEAELIGLTDEQVSSLCTDPDSAPEVSDNTEKLLNLIFEGDEK